MAKRTLVQTCLLGLLLLLPAAARAQFTYTTNNGAITLTRYSGAGGPVTISNFVNSIGANAFEFAGVTSVTISDSVTNIGSGAFALCSRMTNVMIGDGVISIGADAFLSSALTGIAIPGSVTSIGTQAFSDCAQMTAITVDPSNPAFSSVEGVLFDIFQTTLIQYPGALVGAYSIPNGVTNIGVAFQDCNGLTSVAIPDSVSSVGANAFSASSLTSVTTGDGVASIGASAFFNCTSLRSATIGNSVTNIGANAFEECGLAIIMIGNHVTSIGQDAFDDCDDLISITVPKSVTTIGANAFAQCGSLQGIYFQGNAPASGANVFAQDLVLVAVYYYSATMGWSTTYNGQPTVMLNAPSPPITSIGIFSNEFGFTFNGTNTQVFVVEASTNLVSWQPIQTNTLSGTTFNFTDLQWRNFPCRFYRVGAE
jgi:BspA type Leucine rich repeat region (6 copies)